jgi:glutamate synthase (NADPH/NADH) small chain
MPARAAERHYAEEEGIEFFLLTSPIRLMGNDQGRLTGMECLRMEGTGRARRLRPPQARPCEGVQLRYRLRFSDCGHRSGRQPPPHPITQPTEEMALKPWGYITGDPETGKTNKQSV